MRTLVLLWLLLPIIAHAAILRPITELRGPVIRLSDLFDDLGTAPDRPLGTAPFHSLVAQAAPAAPAAPPGFTPPSPAVSDYAVYSVTLPQAYYPPHLPHHHHRHPQQHAHYPSLHPYYRNFTPSYI